MSWFFEDFAMDVGVSLADNLFYLSSIGFIHNFFYLSFFAFLSIVFIFFLCLTSTARLDRFIGFFLHKKAGRLSLR